MTLWHFLFITRDATCVCYFKCFLVLKVKILTPTRKQDLINLINWRVTRNLHTDQEQRKNINPGYYSSKPYHSEILFNKSKSYCNLI